MILTRKGFWKIVVIAICYLFTGGVCISLAMLFASIGMGAKFLFVLGVVTSVLGFFIILIGRYGEGTAKLVNSGNKLVRNELRPAEFLKGYEEIRNSNELLINKPSIEVLQLVAFAHMCLGEYEQCLSVADEMIMVTKENKKTYAKLLKVGFLFASGKIDEAENLFVETQKQKLDFMCNALVDSIMKCDRAMAMGDYKIVEAYNLKLLDRTYPKQDNLEKLLAHYNLGVVYEKLEDREKASSYYYYCINYGGETAIKTEALSRLRSMQ